MKRLRIIDRPTFKAQWQVEPRNLWVGLFWRRTEIALHLYICLVPLLPLHVTIATGKTRRELSRRMPGEYPIGGYNQPCKQCGASEGTFSERGFARCKKCGYPGQ